MNKRELKKFNKDITSFNRDFEQSCRMFKNVNENMDKYSLTSSRQEKHLTVLDKNTKENTHRISFLENRTTTLLRGMQAYEKRQNALENQIVFFFNCIRASLNVLFEEHYGTEEETKRQNKNGKSKVVRRRTKTRKAHGKDLHA